MKNFIQKQKIDKLDALLITAHVLKCDKLDILTLKRQPNFIEKIRIKWLVGKRKRGVPLAYILGEQEFMELSFLVNKHVLIPREDTEPLVRAVLPYCNRKKKILEIGTGSGAIAISIAKLGRKTRKICAMDISRKALKVAEKNARLHNVDAKVRFFWRDIFEEKGWRDFDILISNPPYIPMGVIPTLQTEVKDNEPMIALSGGEDGMRFYRRIAEFGKKALKSGGMIFLEIGDFQGNDVIDIMKDYKYIGSKVDISGTIRVLIFEV